MIEVRQLQEADHTAYRRVFLEAVESEPANFSDSPAVVLAWPEQFWKDRMATGRFFGAFDGHELIGIIGHFPHGDDKCVHRTEMSLFYLAAEYRGSGLAKRLYAAMETHARHLGARQIELDVSAKNPRAISFYLKEGYIEFGRLPEAARVSDGYVDSVLMYKRI